MFKGEIRMRILEGNLIGQDKKFAIVAGRFNEFIVSKLIGGSLDAFLKDME